jgi:hypothetical protein
MRGTAFDFCFQFNLRRYTTVAAAAFTGVDGAPAAAAAFAPPPAPARRGSSFVTPPTSPGLVYHPGAGGAAAGVPSSVTVRTAQV